MDNSQLPATYLLELALFKQRLHNLITRKGITIPLNPVSGYIPALESISSNVDYRPDDPTPPMNVAMKCNAIRTTEPSANRILYVRPGGSGARDGSSWDNAFAHREDAIVAAESGDNIYVMEGLYYLSTVQTPKYGVGEYYGFSQRNPAWEFRDPYRTPSKFDAYFSANHWRNDSVVFAPWQFVDGLWIQNVIGASGLWTNVSSKFRNMFIQNCQGVTHGSGARVNMTTIDGAGISFCTASSQGGGVLLSGTSSLSNFVIGNCHAPQGGGIYATTTTQTTITDGDVLNCGTTSQSQYGGGVYAATGVILDNITTNSCGVGSYSYGGGVVLSGGTARNCRAVNCFAGNASQGAGFCMSTGATLVNSSVISCTCGTHGGGVYVGAGCNVFGCTVIACAAPFGSGMYCASTPKLYNNIAYNCSFYFGTPNYAWKIYNNASNVPLSFATGADTLADIQNFIALDANPFTALGLPPFDLPGAYYQSSPKIEESLIFIDNAVTPFLANPHILAVSSLAGAGYYEEGFTPTTDADGKTRPNPPSIGAYEP